MELLNLSRHFSTLVKAGVIITWQEGVRMNYKIADERIFDLISLTEKNFIERLNMKNSIII